MENLIQNRQLKVRLPKLRQPDSKKLLNYSEMIESTFNWMIN